MATLSGAIDQLRKLVGRPPHDYIPSAQYFLELDVEKIADDLELQKKGAERGEANLPPSDSEAFDAVEQEIIGYCQAEYDRNHHQLTADLQTFRQRLASLNLGGFLVDIRVLAKAALADFEAEVRHGLDELYRRRVSVLERERDLRNFQVTEGLQRAPYYPESHLYHVGIIAVLLLVEGILNGAMLAVGHEFGLLGGILQAIIIAGINVFAGFFAGLIFVRQLFHPSQRRKRVGVVGILLFLGFSFFFNLGVAHYRDALQALDPEAGKTALNTLLTAPLAVASMESWLLMIMGIAFSLIAAADGFYWDDPYPGFGHLARLRDRAYEDYVEGKEEQLAGLEEKRESAVDAMRAAKRAAENRLAEYGAIIAHRQSLISHFARRGDALERIANQLLAIYREANQLARSSRPPAHFRRNWEMRRIEVKVEKEDEPPSEEELRKSVADVGQVLERSIATVQDAYLRATKRFQQIEELTERQLVAHHGEEEKP